MGFTIDIEGDLGDRLDDMTEEIKQVLQDELNAFGLETVAMAKQLCPVDEGTMRNLITYQQLPLPDIGVEISSNAPYSAYIEWGTGVWAAAYVPTLSPEIQAYAMTFFVNGKGRIPPKPFLLPAIESNRVDLIKRLNAQLNS